MRSGYTLYFTYLPLLHILPCPSSETPLMNTSWDRKSPHLGALEPVPAQQREKGFFSKYYLVPKKNRRWRLLNNFVKAQRLWMLTLAPKIQSLEPGDWFLTLDLQDLYFHVAINPSHQIFLWFLVGQDHFKYQVLPFNVSSAQKVFSKVLAVVTTYLCWRVIILFPYLDCWLLKGLQQDSFYHKDSFFPVPQTRSSVQHWKVHFDSCTKNRIHRGLLRHSNNQNLAPHREVQDSIKLHCKNSNNSENFENK